MDLMEKRVKAKAGETVTIIPIGDTHVGSNCFDKEYFEDMIKWILNEKNTYVIGMGDYVDAITHMDVNRYDIENIDYEFNTPEKQHQYISKWFGKLVKSGKLICLIEGNHEYEIRHRYNHEHCKRWSVEFGVPSLGVQGMLRFVIEEPYKTKQNKTHKYDIFMHHGHGGGRRTGTAVNKIQDFSSTYLADLYLMGHCLSLDTEILTEDGWKGYGEVSRNDKAMSFNMESGKLELNMVNDLYLDLDSRQHVEFRGNNLDMAVTPSHNVVCKSINSKKYKMESAIDLIDSTVKIPLCGEYDYLGSDYSDEYIKLFGWMISEGGFAGRKSGMTITQSSDNSYKIKELLDNIGLKYSVYTRDSIGRESTFPDGSVYKTKKLYDVIYIHAEDSKQFRVLFDEQKRVPIQLLNEMSKEQFLMMLETLVEGDGYNMSDSAKIYYTSDEILADQIQVACITRGIKCTKKIRKGSFELLINTRFGDTSISPNRGSVSIRNINEDEYSWCVSVDNGTLVTRRNGKVAITGNTHDKFANIEARVKIARVKDSDGNLQLIQKKVGFVNTGTFMDTFKVGAASTYAERKGFGVKMKGVVKILLTDGDMHLRP